MVVLFLASNEAPNFITLYVFDGNVLALILKKPPTAITSQHQNLHDRVLVNTCESLNRTNRATLDKEVDNSFHFLGGCVHAAQMLISWL